MVFKLHPKGFWKARDTFVERKNQLLNDPKAFFFFIFFTMLSIQIYYTLTLDNLFPLLLLGTLWAIFWASSTKTGRIFLVIAPLAGILHDIYGVYLGDFTYATSQLYGVPLWIPIGYGCIYWSIENFWHHAEDHHYFKENTFKLVAISSIFLFILLDIFYFDLPVHPATAGVYAILVILLFANRNERHLALTVALVTGFNETFGQLIGSWNYPVYSLIELVPTYTFFVWVLLFITHSLLKDRKISKRELVIASALVILWAASQIIYPHIS